MRGGFQPEKKDKYKINENIKAEKVRLVGQEDGQQVVPLSEALKMAQEMELDLVEISSQNPPVVKIMDVKKYIFEQNKINKEAKKKQKVVQLKEIKMRPAIDGHDFDHKIKRAKGFLEKGDKVKFTLMFRGREMAHQNLGFDVMTRVREVLVDIAQVEKPAIREGRNITMFMALKASEVAKK